ncbi:hypothetical protein RQP46_002330 [Phenoliferia psychrophenolica]
MADNDAPAASRATTLSTLPLEIKARICELAALQDEGYKERWIPGAPGEKLVEVHKNEWRGRSLAALSETSKEFNELAAKHIFHTLTDTQIDSLEFSLVVIPRHASRVRRVVIKRPGTSLGRQVACQRVFAALLGLPNLTDLHASYDPTSNALGGFGTALGTPSGATGQIRNAFRAVALRLRTVAIVNFPSADATLSFLEMCKNVQNLKIMGRVIIEDEKLLSEHIQHLCVTGPNGKMLSNNVIGAMTFFETEQVLSSRSSRRDPFLQRKPTASTQESLSLALKVRHRAIDEALAMADNDAPLARLATLSTLPPEIKARICELAALQDERYKERWVPGAPGEELVKVHKNAWRGKSLAALSETSKEFNELASKHIFHTLTDTQIDSFMFALVVLPKHTSRVRRVNIKRPTLGPAARDVRPVFAALPLLPKLSDLKITHAAVLEVLGDLTQDPVEGQTRMFRDVFRPVARRLRTVALVNFLTVDSVVALLAMGESLQDITVTGPTVAEQRLGEYLSKITTLERLTLDATSAGSAGLHFASGWPTLETLSSLALINIKLEANSVALINQHALTLRHLTLRLPYDSPPTPTPTPGFPLFNKLPILSTITLQNISSDLFESVVAAIAVATTTNSNPAESTVHALTIELKDRGKPLIKSRLLDLALPSRLVEPYISTTCAYCKAVVEFLPPPPLHANTAPSSHKVECASCGLKFLSVKNIPGCPGETFRLTVDLPNELITSIISLAKEDTPTLLSSCLVSKQWNVCATDILRREICGDWPWALRVVLPRFTKQPELYQLVRKIELRGGFHSDLEELTDTPSGDHILTNFVARFPRLDHLVLKMMSKYMRIPGPVKLLPSLRKLEWIEPHGYGIHGDGGTEPPLQILLSRAPNLEELHSNGTLRMSELPKYPLVKLSTFHLGHLWTGDLSFHSLIGQSAPNLIRIHINQYHGDDPEVALGHILSLAHHLEVLKIDGQLNGGSGRFYYGSSRPTSTPSLLSALSNSRLEHLKLPFYVDRPFLGALPTTLISLEIDDAPPDSFERPAPDFDHTIIDLLLASKAERSTSLKQRVSWVCE